MRFPLQNPAPARLQDSAALVARIVELERELDHHRRLAMLGVLAAGIAHEFNNILTPVLAYAEMSRSATDDLDLVKRGLDKIVAGVEKAAKISESILALAAPNSGSDSPVTPIRDCIDAALSCLARDPSRDGIRVSICAAPMLAAAIAPASLQQVLLNVLLNARAAMRSHGGELTIRASSTGNIPSPLVTIEVDDTGCGIPSEFIPRIFDPFVSSDPGVTSAGSLTLPGRERRHGLGLAICKQLIEQAGGSITVESTVGVGSRFTIRLPAADVRVQAQAA